MVLSASLLAFSIIAADVAASVPPSATLTIREAIRTALEHDPAVRVTRADDGSIVVGPTNPDGSIWRFQADLLGKVRSVEEAYRDLARAREEVAIFERADRDAEAVLHREQTELLLRGTLDMEGAERQLKAIQKDLSTRKSTVATAERTLREQLGLAKSDVGIVVTTPTTAAPLTPDLDASQATMLAHRPEIVEQAVIVRLGELGLLTARNQLLPVLSPDEVADFRALGLQLDRPGTGASLLMLAPILRAVENGTLSTSIDGTTPETFLDRQRGYTFPLPIKYRGPLANARSAQYLLIRARNEEQRLRDRATYQLGRAFLEIEAAQEPLRAASRTRLAAAEKRKREQGFYNEGRILAGRYSQAIHEDATAEAAEARCRASYGRTLIAFEEAKGTLLDSEGIVVESPNARKPIVPSSR